MVKLPAPSVVAAWPESTAWTLTPGSALPADPASPLTTVPIPVAGPGADGEDGDSESLQLFTKKPTRSRPVESVARSVRRIAIPSSVIAFGRLRIAAAGSGRWGNREAFEPDLGDYATRPPGREGVPGPEKGQVARPRGEAALESVQLGTVTGQPPWAL